MDIDQIESAYASLWRKVRGGNCNIYTKVGLSIFSGALLIGLSLLFLWLWVAGSYIAPNVFVRGTFGGISNVEATLAVGSAIILWLVALDRVWRPVHAGWRHIYVRYVKPTILTCALGAATAATVTTAQAAVHRNESSLIAAIYLVATAVAVLIWLPALEGCWGGRAVLNRDKRVNVNCPNCHYDMTGLRETRCPECGAEFTIDELILAQNYVQPAHDTAEPVLTSPIQAAQPIDGAPLDTAPPGLLAT